MWSSIAIVKRFFGGNGWICMMLFAAVLAVGVLAHMRGLRLDAVKADAARRIQAEQAAHNATRTELAMARADIAWLNVALDLAENATRNMQDSLRDALQREAEAASAAAARKKILDQVRTRVRTEAERMEVVDDATRDAVAVRLNRPL